MDGGREERLALRIADAAGPLRVSAAEILELEGGPVLAPRDALARLTEDWTCAVARRGAGGDQRGARDAAPRAGPGR